MSLEDLEAVARRGATVCVRPQALRKVADSRQLNDALIASGVPIYGVTTGFGDSAHRQISMERASQLQRSLINFLGCGTGSNLPLDQARAVTLARLNCLAKGYSGIRPVVLERLADLLNAGAAPVIPEQGSIGASGDLVPSSYLAAVLCGERQVIVDHEAMPAGCFWRQMGKEPVQLLSKEGLGMVNGTCFMTGIGALAALDARRIARLADALTALTAEALQALGGPFQPFIHRVKGHAGQWVSASNIRRLLEGSGHVREYQDVVQDASPSPDRYRELDQRIQDSYSLRCAPQCIGALYDTIEWVTSWITCELNSANDNPLFDTDDRQVHSGGNFSGFHVALAMDSLKTAVASVVDLLDRQLELLVDEKFNNGLTPNLVPRLEDGDDRQGIAHGFKGMQIAMSSLAAEALNRTMPMTAFSRSTECHNQDKVSMGAAAARQARDVIEIADRAAAIHLLAACQAADLRGSKSMAPGTLAIYENVRRLSPALEADRPLDGDIVAVTHLLRCDALEGSLQIAVTGDP